MELFKNPENLSIISMKYLYQYCVNNIPRVREILVPLTDETIIAMSDYVWEQVWDIFDADSFSILPRSKKLFVCLFVCWVVFNDAPTLVGH